MEHIRLVKFFEDQLALSQSVSPPASLQDLETFRSLGGEVTARFCAARQELETGELRDIVRVAFLDPVGFCGGSEY